MVTISGTAEDMAEVDMVEGTEDMEEVMMDTEDMVVVLLVVKQNMNCASCTLSMFCEIICADFVFIKLSINFRNNPRKIIKVQKELQLKKLVSQAQS